MKFMVITNNPMVRDRCGGNVVYLGSLEDVLTHTRDRIHSGYMLLTHPLSGSVKPNVTPYKTILVSADAASGTDQESLDIIENAIIMTRSQLRCAMGEWSSKTLLDFQLIDYCLVGEAIEAHG